MSDVIINLALSILRQQSPSVLGLEHTESRLRNTSTIRKSSFLKILYGVTVSGNEKGEISF